MKFVQKLISIRQHNPILQKRKFSIHRTSTSNPTRKSIVWIASTGTEMQNADWNYGGSHTFGGLFDGECVDNLDDDGNPIKSNTFLFLLNSYWEDVSFRLPQYQIGNASNAFASSNLVWELLLDTTTNTIAKPLWEIKDAYPLKSRSAALLQLRDRQTLSETLQPGSITLGQLGL